MFEAYKLVLKSFQQSVYIAKEKKSRARESYVKNAKVKTGILLEKAMNIYDS